MRPQAIFTQAQLVRKEKVSHGAQERTRTFTSLRTLAPEASASTNFTTWAGKYIMAGTRMLRQRRQKTCMKAPFKLERGRSYGGSKHNIAHLPFHALRAFTSKSPPR